MRPRHFEHVLPPEDAVTVVAGQGVLDLRRVGMTGGTTGQQLVRRFVSAEITEADFAGGSSTENLVVAGLPTNISPIAAHVETLGGPVAGSVDTTGLTVEVGVVGDADGYVPVTNIFGAAGSKASTAAALHGGFRPADALQATFTATGAGAEDLADITGLRLRIVVHYLTES